MWFDYWYGNAIPIISLVWQLPYLHMVLHAHGAIPSILFSNEVKVFFKVKLISVTTIVESITACLIVTQSVLRH